ncbi:MAG TPA: hypothetical protein PLD47_01825 [Aggregatilineales bacterium]|nr:hypothetical protein [Anaerolineales bacterium]HRE46437.1 hypothetical protein [Aggregatilineales bacterium]
MISQPPTSSPDPEETELRSLMLMIFSVVSSILVVGVIIVLVILVGRQFLDSARRPTNATIPYNVNNRNVPLGTTLGTIFPTKVGEFTRTNMGGTLQNFQVIYQYGEARVTVSGSQSVTVVAAQAQVKRIGDREGRGNGGQFIDEARPYYSFDFRYDATVARIAYSRDRWYFEIRAATREALDLFMNGFPY